MTGINIYVDKLRITFDQHTVLNNFCAEFKAHQWHCILGRSGVGKSVFLKAIAGLESNHHSDNITFKLGNQTIDSPRIAWLDQNDGLLPWLNVVQNITLPIRLNPQNTPKHGVNDLVNRLGLKGLESRLPSQLSGGQRQRVALARTLMHNAPIVLMDEPFSALDALSKLELQDLAFELLTEHTVILITHDPLEALRLGHTVSILDKHPQKLQYITQHGSPIQSVDDPNLLAQQAHILSALSTGGSV